MAGAKNVYQRQLVHLTQVSRAQVMNIADELTWFLWDADEAVNA